MSKLDSPIELIPPIQFEELKTTQKITSWVISVGRVVIIVTELIAFSVFVGRIKLDREITDLTKTLTSQKRILYGAADIEKKVRDTNERSTIVYDLRQKQNKTSPTLTYITKNIPTTISLLEMGINADVNTIAVDAQTASAPEFIKMVANFKNNSHLTDLVLTEGKFELSKKLYKFRLEIKTDGKELL